MAGDFTISDGGPNPSRDGTRMVQVRVVGDGGAVVFSLDAAAAIRIGESLIVAGRQGGAR